MVNIKLAFNLLDKLIQGDKYGIGDLVKSKLEGMGQDLIQQYIAGPMSVAERFSQAVETGGVSEFNRTRDHFLNSLKPRAIPHSGLVRKVAGIFEKRAKRVRRYRPGTWQASNWATSRRDWLDNRWKHDWRSQPRDILGRWIPGRLDYIPIRMQYRGKKVGRVVLRRRKRRRLRKVASRREIRKILKRTKLDGD